VYYNHYFNINNQDKEVIKGSAKSQAQKQ